MQFSLQELDAVATGEPEGRSLVDALNAAAARLAEIGDKTASEGPRAVGLITYRGSPFLEAKPSRPRR